MSIHPHAGAPTSAAQRRILAEGHRRYGGNLGNRIVDAAIKLRKLRRPVTRQPRIHVRNDPVVLREPEILFLQSL